MTRSGYRVVTQKNGLNKAFWRAGPTRAKKSLRRTREFKIRSEKTRQVILFRGKILLLCSAPRSLLVGAVSIAERTVWRSLNRRRHHHWTNLSSFNKVGRIPAHRFTPKVIWEVVNRAGSTCGLSNIAPHDLRRTCARLCHLAGGRARADPILAWACERTNDRALPRMQTAAA